MTDPDPLTSRGAVEMVHGDLHQPSIRYGRTKDVQVDRYTVSFIVLRDEWKPHIEYPVKGGSYRRNYMRQLLCPERYDWVIEAALEQLVKLDNPWKGIVR